MKIRVNTLSLVGAKRTYSFEPGLNIISGPIATGKSTLLRCIRGMFGSGLDNFSREARETITNLAGQISIGDENYYIVRPFVTTNTARVDIAGVDETERLPVLRATTSSEITYGKWLLRKLNLPVLEVPIAPTKPDTDFSPVSINDYMMYSYLRQGEIDNSVFGHDNHFKNSKRKYVFEIIYQKYDVEVARLRELLRDAHRELNRLRNQAATMAEILEGTPFSNKARLESDIVQLQSELENIEDQTNDFAETVSEDTGSAEIREQIRSVDIELDRLRTNLTFEKHSKVQMELLVSQLENQSNRLTRSIVAESYLLDFDFIICPRCGSSVETNRTSSDTCYLCLQEPEGGVSRNDLINEQNKLEKQIDETRELIVIHTQSIARLESAVEEKIQERQKATEELDFLTRSYVSDSASTIANSAGERAKRQERLSSLREYLKLFLRQDETQQRMATLMSQIEDIEARIDAAISSEASVEDRIRVLENHFRDILDVFEVPKFADPGFTGIDRQTYLPLLEGRRFDELHSQGLKVMVNVAHTLAHQLAAIELNLQLPNILLIDGLTGNIGYEGLDLERVESIYSYLIDFANQYSERIQIIVADNTVPAFASEFVRIELSEEEKLIPSSVLSR